MIDRVGSSPRVWGRFAVQPDLEAQYRRFIPTRVGQICRRVFLAPVI